MHMHINLRQGKCQIEIPNKKSDEWLPLFKKIAESIDNRPYLTVTHNINLGMRVEISRLKKELLNARGAISVLKEDLGQANNAVKNQETAIASLIEENRGLQAKVRHLKNEHKAALSKLTAEKKNQLAAEKQYSKKLEGDVEYLKSESALRIRELRELQTVPVELRKRRVADQDKISMVRKHLDDALYWMQQHGARGFHGLKENLMELRQNLDT